jgi:hypothetical protein
MCHDYVHPPDGWPLGNREIILGSAWLESCQVGLFYANFWACQCTHSTLCHCEEYIIVYLGKLKSKRFTIKPKKQKGDFKGHSRATE